MKKLFMIAVAATASLPLAAQAKDSADGNVTLTASTPKTCAIRDISYEGGKNVQGGTVTFADAVNAKTAQVDETTYQNLNLNAFCNYATHYVSLKSQNGGLTNTTDTSIIGTFNKRIGYRVLITNWDPDSSINEFLATGNPENAEPSKRIASTEIKKAVNKAKAGFRIATMVSNLSGNKDTPMLAGDYTDVLTIQLGVALQ